MNENLIWHDNNVIPDDSRELVVIAGYSKEKYNLYTGCSRLGDDEEQQWYFVGDDREVFGNRNIYKWAYCKDLVNSIICSDNHTSDGCKNTEKPFY